MAALTLIYVALLTVRMGLAIWYSQRRFGEFSITEPAAILQPILSGDPALEATLGANAQTLSNEHFYWLVDNKDTAGKAAARRAARPNVQIVTGPGPEDGENPKVAKLARALELVVEEVTVVLDDDTRIGVVEMGRLRAALDTADLVTGLPVFISEGSIYERFIGGFVNGNAALTYLPAAAVGAQRTINGMIYALRTEEFRRLGGFSAIVGQLTDDYALARLYERNGKRVLQTAVCVAVGMTIRDAAHCGRVLRRWFLFANRYLRDNTGIATLLLVALPSALPLAGLFFGWKWLVVLFGKALCNRILLWRISGRASDLVDLFFEVTADILAPLFFVSALVQPRELSWRSRRIVMDGDRIRYQ